MIGKRRTPQKHRAKSVSLPAPVGGWNARDALGEMKPDEAVSLQNLFPSTTSCVVRFGRANQLSNVPGQVETLMSYSGSTTNKLLAIAGGSVYDASSVGSVTTIYYANLTGGGGTYISTPNATVNRITGDIQFDVNAAADDWSVAGVLVAKWTFAGSQEAYLFGIGAGSVLVMETSSTGGAVDQIYVSTATIPAVNGNPIYLRGTIDVNNGAGGNTGTFYTSTDGVTWTQLGAPVVNAGVSSILGSSAEVRVGVDNAGGAVFKGKVYKAQIYNGIGGTLVVSMSAADNPSMASSWSSSLTGETWTLNGAASVVAVSNINPQLTGLTNSRWQYINVATSGGNYIEMANGVDSVRLYDGTTWTIPTISGVASSELIGINLFKNRVWFIQVGTLKAWYLPVQSIQGAANALDLSAFAPHGGYLMAMATWTIDAGYGVDDMAVFITSNGDVLVYRGTDPSSASTWALVGVWWLGSPVGRRCFVKYKGDVLLLTQDGVLPLSSALQSSRLNPRVALTDIIQQATSQAVTTYGANFGWQMLPFPQQNMLILNVPVQQGNIQQQYVMNTITGKWCQFTGWYANCWELHNNDVYFGGNNLVSKAWSTNSDAGSDIDMSALQAFNYFGSPGQLKRFTMMRPTLLCNGSPSIQGSINVNFDLSAPTANLSTLPVQGAVWDAGAWDSALWGDELTLSNSWQGATGVGYCGAPRLASTTNGLQLQWVSTEVVLEPGGIL